MRKGEAIESGEKRKGSGGKKGKLRFHRESKPQIQIEISSGQMSREPHKNNLSKKKFSPQSPNPKKKNFQFKMAVNNP